MKIKRILVFFLLGIGSFDTTCQTNFGIEGNIGFSVPTNFDLSNVYDAGLNFELAIPIALLRENKLRVKPLIRLLWYFKEVERVNSVNEHTKIFKYGLEIEYQIFSNKNFSLSPFVSLTDNFITNYYSSTSYNPFDNTSTTSLSDDFMTGNEVGLQLGTLIRIDDFFFKLGYSILQPTLELNEFIINDLEQSGIIVEPSTELNFNAVNVSIGYTYWF